LIIEEAGMADTLSLDTAVQFAIGRGASVRLLGDDQQLAAIGADGVLRDITHTHGALRLTELHRFTDPAEAAATLAIREGKPEAFEFDLDHEWVHVDDLATTTKDAFAAPVSDRAAGLDTIMLAPTRELVAELNRQTRDHLLGNQVRDCASHSREQAVSRHQYSRINSLLARMHVVSLIKLLETDLAGP
jgi:ATP-dependent exoDNAse (exonuclease V) alpha subunit